MEENASLKFTTKCVKAVTPSYPKQPTAKPESAIVPPPAVPEAAATITPPAVPEATTTI
ncbi:unnamed protein product, partial [marine sediment metagenome]